MPTLSASDYTTFVKLKAANAAYVNGKVPTSIQTSFQPYPTVSVLNSQLLASQASLVLTPGYTTLVSSAMGRVRPYDGYGYVNHPQARSTVSTSAAGNMPLAPGSTARLFSPPPPGRPHVA